MTKRTNKPKVVPTINSTPPKQAVEGDKGESNTVATPKTRRANSKAPAKPRGRPKKKVIIEQVYEVLEPKVEATYVAPATLALPTSSKYERFKAWLVFKLYHYTSYFRGF